MLLRLFVMLAVDNLMPEFCCFRVGSAQHDIIEKLDYINFEKLRRRIHTAWTHLILFSYCILSINSGTF